MWKIFSLVPSKNDFFFWHNCEFYHSKLKSKHTSLKRYTNWEKKNIFLSFWEKKRRKNQIFRTSNSFAAVTFRIRGNLWHKNMLSWIIHFCTVVGFSQGSRLQNTSTEVTSLLGSPHFVISFLTNLKISNENSSVGRIGCSQPALSSFSNAFNSGSVIRSFFLWS